MSLILPHLNTRYFRRTGLSPQRVIPPVPEYSPNVLRQTAVLPARGQRPESRPAPGVPSLYAWREAYYSGGLLLRAIYVHVTGYARHFWSPLIPDLPSLPAIQLTEFLRVPSVFSPAGLGPIHCY